MKAKINIEISDNTTQEQVIAAGITNEYLKRLYEMAFRNILDAIELDAIKDDPNPDNRCEYILNVEITE